MAGVMSHDDAGTRYADDADTRHAQYTLAGEAAGHAKGLDVGREYRTPPTVLNVFL
jgi:hypothetical protein